ncbi:purine nucleoside phosphorylase [Echinococcus multilocularis]|uniref:Purine nucleoside phosphorylase n=1 Tax=Echinococcus multilocularis TaxID=6211 RepID=A0A068Y9G1_ECHMU|nr:purine nucleoside phosphorylase [Echinococcus multilocularis]
MSTAYETVVAKHADLKVFAISLIADIAVLDKNTEVPITHEEVLHTTGKRAERVNDFNCTLEIDKLVHKGTFITINTMNNRCVLA